MRLAVVLFVLALARSAAAVSLEGPSDAQTRVGIAGGTGFDTVDGFGADRFAFVEAAVHADARLWRWLAIGGAATFRQDLRDHVFALGTTRDRHARAVAAQLFVGYDGPAFHLSVGPWLYGDGRYDDQFRAAFAPWGALRLRAGNLDRWHVTFSVLDGAPYTAAGAGTAVRLMVGPGLVYGRHRPRVGPYFTLGEVVRGLSVSDELALTPRPGRPRAVRFGGSLGGSHEQPSRWEAMAFGGIVW